MRQTLALIATFVVFQLPAPASFSAEGPQQIIARAKELNKSDADAATTLLEAAIDLYTKQTTEQPQDDEAWYGLACVTFEYGKDDRAAANALKTAIRLKPNAAAYYSQKGLMLSQLGKGPEAERAYEKAVELAPKLIETRLAQSQALYNLGKNKEAADALVAAHEIAPLDCTVMTRLAIFKMDAGEPEQTLALLKKALATDPKDVEIRDGIGQLMQEIGQNDEAYKIYLSLAEKVPTSVNYESRLIQLCQSLTRIEERDRRLKHVYELYGEGKAQRAWFCREKFKVGKLHVVAVEYYQLQGQFSTKMKFAITLKGKPEKELAYITLDTPEFTTEHARSIGAIDPNDKEKRSWAMEFYRGGGRRNMLLTQGKQPSYEAVCARVVQVLEKAGTLEE